MTIIMTIIWHMALSSFSTSYFTGNTRGNVCKGNVDKVS